MLLNLPLCTYVYAAIDGVVWGEGDTRESTQEGFCKCKPNENKTLASANDSTSTDPSKLCDTNLDKAGVEDEDLLVLFVRQDGEVVGPLLHQVGLKQNKC